MKSKLASLLFFFAALCGSARAQVNNARMLSTPNAQTGTSYTFVAADTTRIVTFNNANPVAATLPNGASLGFGSGTELSVVNLGAGAVTITCSACTINGAGSLVLTTSEGADLYGGSGSPAVNYVALLGAGGGSSGGGVTGCSVPGGVGVQNGTLNTLGCSSGLVWSTSNTNLIITQGSNNDGLELHNSGDANPLDYTYLNQTSSNGAFGMGQNNSTTPNQEGAWNFNPDSSMEFGTGNDSTGGLAEIFTTASLNVGWIVSDLNGANQYNFFWPTTIPVAGQAMITPGGTTETLQWGTVPTWGSATAPTIAGGGCGGSAASIVQSNGTAAFELNVGTSNVGTCTITMPAATHSWACRANDQTTQSTAVAQTIQTGALSTTVVTLKNFTDLMAHGAWTDSDILTVLCGPF